jgi:type IV pilus assembly protein PilX
MQHQQQKGAVLIVALTLLVVLTLLGLSAIQTTTVSTKITSNTQDRNDVFQAAESLLNEAENTVIDVDGNQLLDSTSFDDAADNAIGRHTAGTLPTKTVNGQTVTDYTRIGITTQAANGQFISGNGSRGFYVIEFDPSGSATNTGSNDRFTITVRAQNTASTTQVILQSIIE